MEFHQAWKKSKKGASDAAHQIASVSAGNPPCNAWLKDLHAYSVSTDGEGLLLSELAHCQKSLAPVGASGLRLIGGEMLDRLNNQAGFPYFKNAILKANLTGSACKDCMRLAACFCSCIPYTSRERAVAIVFL